ncbi:MAG: ABC transporter permease subunit [Verrucomicrobiota bacterium]|nr:ABC transporter permease subunit [Verrucomicrobiota bacterium]
MQAILSVFKRELCAYFRTPVGYVFLAVFLLTIMGICWFAMGFFEQGDASLTLFFNLLPWVYLFLIPASGMRLWSEEKRSGTWELLLTLPITTTQAVVGKFLAGWAFVGLGLALTFLMPISVAILGEPDWGPIITGYLGAFIMAGSYLAICSLTSSLTKNQVISFVLSVGICFVLVFLGWNVFSDFMLGLGLPVNVVDAVSNFSFVTHFEPMYKGVIAVRDLLFFASVTISALLLNVVVLER